MGLLPVEAKLGPQDWAKGGAGMCNILNGDLTVTLQCALRGWPFRETPINEWDVGLFIPLWISLRIQVEMQPPSGQATPQRCLAHSNIRHTWKSYVFKFSPKNLQPNVDSKCNQMLSLLNSVKYSLKFVYLLGKEIDNKI